MVIRDDQLHASQALAGALDALLKGFADQGRMKLHGGYVPCYEVRPAEARAQVG